MLDNTTAGVYCSPYNQTKYGQKDGTCYSHKDLQIIAKEYNKLSKDRKIDIKQPKPQLLSSLEQAFQDVCKNEFCWSNSKVISNVSTKRKLQESFRPLKPPQWYDNNLTWLNTYDILFVMKQYEKLYKDFKFFGVFPINFEERDGYDNCIGEFMCTFHLNDLLKQRKKRFAMVLNHDRHDEDGSHWVAVYCDLDFKRKNFGIYYYDSVANPPPPEADNFMKKIQSQLAETKIPKKYHETFEVKVNKIQKQFKDYDCGMFSIISLTQLLKDVPFDYVCEHMKTDDEINQLRNIIYHPSKKDQIYR